MKLLNCPANNVCAIVTAAQSRVIVVSDWFRIVNIPIMLVELSVLLCYVGAHCSKFIKNSTIANCHSFKEQLAYAPTRRLCKYRRCPRPQEHHTIVCGALHQRCPACQIRGHGLTDGCDLQNPEIMSRLRADFEECASDGFYTRRRFEDPAWGWYPMQQTAPRRRFVSYRKLSQLNVLLAIKVVQKHFASGPGDKDLIIHGDGDGDDEAEEEQADPAEPAEECPTASSQPRLGLQRPRLLAIPKYDDWDPDQGDADESDDAT